MTIIVRLALDVGEQDSRENGYESAMNQMRTMDFEELLGIMDYEVLNSYTE